MILSLTSPGSGARLLPRFTPRHPQGGFGGEAPIIRHTQV